MLIGLVAGEGEEGEGEQESHSKVGTLLGPTNIIPNTNNCVSFMSGLVFYYTDIMKLLNIKMKIQKIQTKIQILTQKTTNSQKQTSHQ